ncbi:Ribosomal RNA small subunit methyltransferase H [Leucobacter aridicollis]|uniref:Ribosomal RNA small subunit methyltransferase H n=1 Tax=Leucobacter aridicollis TaxID=283878 RepID=A0A852R6H8_9MICO|nr:16S rRNA (cytosine(1402)-N(4))-methyltransferase RsmH [Leucobacter aridicollis]MBL3683848.1 16S rRNA (cytosine(1402)-N(4))-methyltransferase RsmH [Leucobacter aridicollis]NYD26528.1 16S rRNA (cytosine1402-N4)-methyltransferase [Leucobacter aridicollis]
MAQPTPRNPAELHTSVMLERCVELLAPGAERDGAFVVDATLGMGGHTEALLERFPGLTVIGLDRDTEALELAGARLARFGDRFVPVHAVYDEIDRALAEAGATSIDGALFDLGVSSLQLDDADRGFAYAQDAPLDMRMDQTRGRTAAEILAEEPEGRLRELFERYGEEPLAGRYARAIVAARQVAPLERSGQLVDVLQEATPAAVLGKRHPAKRVFQALRVEVNGELATLERAIPAAIDRLNLGGRLVVMSYQSLEDRIVKRAIQARSRSTAPQGLPVELPEHKPELRILTKGAEQATDEEKAVNPRAIPARLRAAERVREMS